MRWNVEEPPHLHGPAVSVPPLQPRPRIRTPNTRNLRHKEISSCLFHDIDNAKTNSRAHDGHERWRLGCRPTCAV